ncbi:glycosyltransferase family 39 protein [bacterium]|nr:glycosyltransferase family 39 protein [candidate division CSSED10-310 bacterium]
MLERHWRGIFAALLVIFLTTGIYNSFMRPVIVDDAEYANFGMEIARGSLPYKDFYIPQLPVMLYLHTVPQLLFGPSILAGRLLSVLLSLGILVVLFTAARREAGIAGGLTAAALLALNLETVNGLTMTKTHAVTALLLLTGAHFLLAAHIRRNRLVPAAFFFGLACAARVPACAAAGVCIMYIVFTRRQWKRVLLPASVAGATGVLLPFIPNMIGGGLWQAFYTSVLVQLNRGETFVFKGGWPIRLDVLFSHLDQQFPLLVTAAGLLVISMAEGLAARRAWWTRQWRFWALTGMAAAVTLIYWIPNDATRTVYEMDIIPLLYLVAAIGAGRLFARDPRRMRVFIIMVTCCICLHPLTQCKRMVLANYLAYTRDGLTNIRKIQHAGAFIASRTNPDDRMFTFEVSVAVAADRRLMPGLGCHYTYTPHWEEDRCRRFATINDAMIARWVRNREIGVLVLSPGDLHMLETHFPFAYALSHLEKEVVQRQITIDRAFIEHYYYQAAEIGEIGQGGQPLFVFLPRSDTAAG